ncbi:MAG: hypothetical protein GY856_52310 [bacterium]|nr:hypothetical protein [bacterium]
MFRLPDQDLRDEELVLFYYGEAGNPPFVPLRGNPDKIRRRLESSPAARARYDELCRALAAVDDAAVPEPPEDYGAQVWSRLAPQLRDPGSRRGIREWIAEFLSPPVLFSPRRLAAAGALVGMLAVAFVAGRYWPAAQPGTEEPFPATGRERIMLTAVGRHLERSQRLLIELANTAGNGGVDVADERELAEELLHANRIYRSASQRSGKAALAAVLDELERVLLDLARGPEELPAAELEELRSRIDGILFKVQIVGSHVRRGGPAKPQAPTYPPVAGGNEV